ncbi:MAG: TonB-dependent receptor plug domain-containing protein, partial [bacterium]|nr:TonB-dependent receptor plug domain-containing protein [bacterium]
MINFRKIKFSIPSMLILLSVIFISPVNATQDLKFEDILKMSLEDLLNVRVVTAGKKVQKAVDVSASIHIITCQEIDEMGYATIIEALNTVPGINFLEDWTWGGPVFRGVRDALCQRVLLLVDGQATTSKSDNTTNFYYAAPVDIRQIERIELIRGPGSALYGSGAFLGIVNVITKTDKEQFIVNTEASTVGPLGAFLSLSNKIGELHLTVSGSYNHSNGQDLEFQFPYGMPPDYIETEGIADGYNTVVDKKLSLKLAYKNFSFHIYHSHTKIGWPHSYYWTDFNSHENYNRWTMTLIQTNYRHIFSEKLEIANRSYYNAYDNLWNGVYYGELYVDSAGELAKYGGDYYGTEFQLLYSPNKKVSFVNGFEFTNNPGIYATQAKRSFTNVSLYSVLDYKFSHWLKINLGARVEKYSFRNKAEFIPKAALLLKPNKKSVLKV